MQLLKMNRVIKKQFKSKNCQLVAFLKKFDIKQIFVVNHQPMDILSNFGSRKTENREIIGTLVKDFGTFIRNLWNQSLVKTQDNRSDLQCMYFGYKNSSSTVLDILIQCSNFKQNEKNVASCTLNRYIFLLFMPFLPSKYQ